MLDRLVGRTSGAGAGAGDGSVEPLALRILVAGDAAVGKTALIEHICCGGSRRADVPKKAASEWTCGCSLSVAHETIELDLRPTEVDVELWEVGGTQTYTMARPVFYEDFDAVVLVYDVSNMKSYHNLVAWLFELCMSCHLPSLRYWDAGGGSGGMPAEDLEGARDDRALQQAILAGRCPVLFVANKCDLGLGGRGGSSARGGSGLGAGGGAAGGASTPKRPVPPEGISLIDRLLGGDGGVQANMRRTPADEQLLEQLCDLVQRGRHTEASSKEEKASFDFALWRDFVRRIAEARPSGSVAHR